MTGRVKAEWCIYVVYILCVKDRIELNALFKRKTLEH